MKVLILFDKRNYVRYLRSWSQKVIKISINKKSQVSIGTCAKVTTLSGGPKVEKDFQVKFMGLEHHGNPKPTKEKRCYPCNVPASMHFSSMAPPNVHVCHTRRLPQSKSFHVLLTLTTHSMYYQKAPQTRFFTSHTATSLEVLHAWSFIYVENGRE